MVYNNITLYRSTRSIVKSKTRNNMSDLLDKLRLRTTIRYITLYNITFSIIILKAAWRLNLEACSIIMAVAALAEIKLFCFFFRHINSNRNTKSRTSR